MQTIMGIDLGKSPAIVIVNADGVILDQHYFKNPNMTALKACRWQYDVLSQALAGKHSLVVMENVLAGARGFKSMEATLYPVGAYYAVMCLANAPVLTVTPLSLKKWFAGSGKASKQDMIETARSKGMEVDNHNLADAYALALYGLGAEA